MGSGGSSMCARSEIAAQSTVQPRSTVTGSSRCSASLQAHARIGRLAARTAQLEEYGLAKRRLSRLCGLHADVDVQREPGQVRRAREARARRADVRRGPAVALPSFIDCGCSAGQRHRGTRDHQRRSHAAALADAAGTRGRRSGNLSEEPVSEQ